MVADRQARQAAERVLVSQHVGGGVPVWVGRNNADTLPTLDGWGGA